jgi:hypothetical protein
MFILLWTLLWAPIWVFFFIAASLAERVLPL